MSDLRNAFDELAEHVARTAKARLEAGDVIGNAGNLADATDALKAVTAYLAVLRKPDKGSAGNGDDTDDDFNFGRGITEARNGRAQVRSRPG